MTLRVYIDTADLGIAPEPVGYAHDGCAPDTVDGFDVITETTDETPSDSCLGCLADLDARPEIDHEIIGPSFNRDTRANEVGCLTCEWSVGEIDHTSDAYELIRAHCAGVKHELRALEETTPGWFYAEGDSHILSNDGSSFFCFDADRSSMRRELKKLGFHGAAVSLNYPSS